MKYIKFNYLVIIIYLISFSFGYSIDTPDNKNLIIHKEKKKIENIEFFNSKRKKVSLFDYKSNIIIVNFWATWCAPCKEELPSLNRLKSNSNFKDIEIIPINIGGERFENSKSFFKNLKIDKLEFFLGEGGELAKKFNIRGIPTTILIDKNGYEFARIVGYIDFENKDFLDWLVNYL